MAMTINIEIQGSVICYRQGSYWQFVFMCDRWHKVKLTHIHNGATTTMELRKDKEDRHIIFDFDSVAPPAYTENLSKILNMADPRLHGTDAQGKVKLKRKRKNANAKEMIFMSIPAFRLITIEETAFPYEIALDVATPSPVGIGKVAKIVGGTITLNSGTGGEMIFNDGGNLQFPFRDGDIHTLKFDNDCGQNCESGQNDFRLYYNWLEDTGNSGKKFIGGKVRPGESADKVLRSSDQGNCDPIGSFPPPGP